MEPVPRDWPALMDLAAASAYLAVAPGSAASLLRRENIAPVGLGLRLRRWRRRDLDELLARLPRLGSPGGPERSPEDVAIEQALAAVERRSGERRAKTLSRRTGEIRQPHPPA